MSFINLPFMYKSFKHLIYTFNITEDSFRVTSVRNIVSLILVLVSSVRRWIIDTSEPVQWMGDTRSQKIGYFTHIITMEE